MSGKITSRKNPQIQQARAVRDGRERELVFVEGVRLCEEALSAGIDFESVLYTAELEDSARGLRLVEALRRVCPRALPVSESVLEYVADTKTSQGVVALARRPRTGAGVIGLGVETPLVVVMHRANNPANAGAMLRVAEAAGATAAVSTKGSTDLFSARALRGSMGSAFRLPLWTGATLDETLAWCAERGIRTVSTGATASIAHTDIDWTIPRAVLVGPEAGGLTDEEARAADECVRIPMRAPVDSLNVAVALGVILYEAARQRAGGRRQGQEAG
ncbi:MAG TPA: RNA methyltransferase [Pyrinomonadaceae bacterium]|nr:RNA methyltransferase [Pyrinomonadaceae bacterium]